MEHITCTLDAEAFDKAIQTQPDGPPVLPEGGDIQFIFKPEATLKGNPAVCITFSVMMPDGTIAKAQAVTTVKCLDMVAGCIRGWRAGGHLKE